MFHKKTTYCPEHTGVQLGEIFYLSVCLVHSANYIVSAIIARTIIIINIIITVSYYK